MVIVKQQLETTWFFNKGHLKGCMKKMLNPDYIENNGDLINHG